MNIYNTAPKPEDFWGITGPGSLYDKAVQEHISTWSWTSNSIAWVSAPASSYVPNQPGAPTVVPNNPVSGTTQQTTVVPDTKTTTTPNTWVVTDVSKPKPVVEPLSQQVFSIDNPTEWTKKYTVTQNADGSWVAPEIKDKTVKFWSKTDLLDYIYMGNKRDTIASQEQQKLKMKQDLIDKSGTMTQKEFTDAMAAIDQGGSNAQDFHNKNAIDEAAAKAYDTIAPDVDKIFKESYASSNLPTYLTSIGDLQTKMVTSTSEFAKASAEINSNPWMSGAQKDKQVATLKKYYDADVASYTKSISNLQDKYDSGIKDITAEIKRRTDTFDITQKRAQSQLTFLIDQAAKTKAEAKTRAEENAALYTSEYLDAKKKAEAESEAKKLKDQITLKKTVPGKNTSGGSTTKGLLSSEVVNSMAADIKKNVIDNWGGMDLARAKVAWLWAENEKNVLQKVYDLTKKP